MCMQGQDCGMRALLGQLNVSAASCFNTSGRLYWKHERCCFRPICWVEPTSALYELALQCWPCSMHLYSTCSCMHACGTYCLGAMQQPNLSDVAAVHVPPTS
jgi:hypothetical protein